MAKSKPYSSVSVKSVEVEVLAATHRGQACVVGIDVAKLELMAVLRWPDGSFLRPWRVVNPAEVGVLVGKLVELRASCPVTVGRRKGAKKRRRKGEEKRRKGDITLFP